MIEFRCWLHGYITETEVHYASDGHYYCLHCVVEGYEEMPDE